MTPQNRRRNLRRWVIAAWAVAWSVAASTATAGVDSNRNATSAAAPTATPRAPRAQAVFAGGCFWCEEATFEGLPGVLTVVSGFSGGNEPSPTYAQVSAGRTGHAESVEITYDPTKTTYEKLLDVYWHNIDPTQKEGQFCDHGHQYRSVIFYANDAQRRAALASKGRLEASKRLKGPIVTEIVPFTRFWPAEEYHQDYYRKNPVEYHAYRLGCGRDARLRQIWGAASGGH